MSFPETLALVRHDVSVFNATNERKQRDPAFRAFKRAFEQSLTSDRTKSLAQYVRANYALKYGDRNTPLAPIPEGQVSRSEIMASRLKEHMPLPDVIYVSPYLRTKQTLDRMKLGWPQLQDVRTIEEEKIVEQAHGLAQLYGDWRVFEALNPEQHVLYGLEGEYQYRYPQGENVPDVQLRLKSWIEGLEGTVVLAVLHHLSLLALRAKIENWDEQHFIRVNSLNRPDNAGVTLYRKRSETGEGKLELAEYNLNLFTDNA